MKFLITGGAGFIGSAVVRHLIHHTQHSVVNLDKLTYAGSLDAVLSVCESKRYAFEQVDICDAAAVERVFAEHQPDVVMHLAAESHVDRSINGPAEFIQTNIVGTYTLLEAARSYWQGLAAAKKRAFVFTMCPPMKCTAICHTPRIPLMPHRFCLPNKPLMHRPRLIPPPKPALII